MERFVPPDSPFLAPLLNAVCLPADFRYVVSSRPMQSAKLDIARLPGSNGNVVAKLTGKLNMETVPGFLRELRTVEAEKLVLDMRDIGFVDSAGVGALVQIFVHRRGKSQKFALARLNPQGMAVMQVAGLHKLLPQFPTVEEACQS